MWRAVDHEGEVLETIVTKKRDKKAALKLLKSLLKRYGRPVSIMTDRLRSYRAAMNELGCADKQDVKNGIIIGLRIATSPSDDENVPCRAFEK